MDLIEVDHINLQSPQTGLAFAANRIGLERFADLAILVPDAGAFAEAVGSVRAAFQRLSHDFFRMAEAIDGGGVNPVHPGIECSVNRGDRRVVVLVTPRKEPTRTAHRPCSDT